MRVTQFTFYNNFLVNHQKELNELTKTQTQIATGKKIQNMYDNPTVFTKYLKLNEEINSFTQIKDSANFALNFARETDTTINDIVTTLTSFKTKLLNAANDTNDITSRKAIVSELKSELEHLKDLANTSIDGKYIFSGSAFDKKPISDDFKYVGNDKYVKAFLGAGVEREYNIPGSEIFLGRDNDYKKHLTTNIPQFDKMKANPEFVVRGADGKLYIDKNNPNPAEPGGVGVNEPININSEIRMLTGVEDIDNGDGSYSDGTSYFYIKGRKPNGESFESVLELNNSKRVGDLLEDIGKLYGNTTNDKVVDVSLNDMGEIQIKDLRSGKMDTDFYMVASDSYDKNLSFEDNLKSIVSDGKYFIEFQKSNFNTIRDISSIKAANSFMDNRVFRFGAVFKADGRDAIAQDSLKSVFGDKALDENGNIQDVGFIVVQGTDIDGNSVGPIGLDLNKNMNDLLKTITDNFKVNVNLINGEIVIEDPSIEKNGNSKFSLNLSVVKDDDNDNVYHSLHDTTKLQAIRRKDSLNLDEIYFEKRGNLINSNISQITKESGFYIKNGEKITKLMDEVYATEDTLVTDVLGSNDLPQTLEIRYKDINGKFNKASITIDEDEITFNVNGNSYKVYDSEGNVTPAFDNITTTSEIDPVTCKLCQKEEVTKGFTYKQLGDVVSMIVSDTLPSSDTPESYNEAVNEAKNKIQTGLDDKGRFYLKDLSSQNSKVEFAMFNLNSNKPSSNIMFMANDAITIDSPQNDFFETLQNAITAVENGKNFADASSNDPRNFGIQGAIEAIEHVIDRVRRSHAKIGAVSNEFDTTIQRVDMLKINVEALQSENIDTDLGEASMKLNSLQVSYQALLASIAKVNNLTLLNYLR